MNIAHMNIFALLIASNNETSLFQTKLKRLVKGRPKELKTCSIMKKEANYFLLLRWEKRLFSVYKMTSFHNIYKGIVIGHHFFVCMYVIEKLCYIVLVWICDLKNREKD